MQDRASLGRIRNSNTRLGGWLVLSLKNSQGGAGTYYQQRRECVPIGAEELKEGRVQPAGRKKSEFCYRNTSLKFGGNLCIRTRDIAAQDINAMEAFLFYGGRISPI